MYVRTSRQARDDGWSLAICILAIIRASLEKTNAECVPECHCTNWCRYLSFNLGPRYTLTATVTVGSSLHRLVKSYSSASAVGMVSGTRDLARGNQSIEQVGLVTHDLSDNPLLTIHRHRSSLPYRDANNGATRSVLAIAR